MNKAVLVSMMVVTMLACSTNQKNISSVKENKMKQSVYFLADGNCRQAMEFYHQVFGGDLTITSVGESQAKDFMPPSFKDKIINARLKSDVVDISASDWLRPDQKQIQGNTVCFYLSGGTFEELKTIFNKLSEGANITDPVKQEFFGTYGALNDKFGIRWMFQTDKN